MTATETFKIEKHHPKSFSLDMVGMTVGLLNLPQQICSLFTAAPYPSSDTMLWKPLLWIMC